MDDLKSIIAKVATGATLSREEAASAFDRMMSGEATPSQLGGLLMALRVRGETVDEITGAVSAVRAKMLRVKAPAGAVDVYIKQSVFPSCMANGLPARQAAVLAATQRPLTSLALTQKSGVPAWKTIPSWAVIGTADHAIPPAELLTMARRAHAHITMAPGAPHLSMISNPGLVTRVILDAAHATT